MTRKTIPIKWLVFTIFYVVGGLCCVGIGIAWYQNEKNIRSSGLIEKFELSLKPITMVAETCVSAFNYYILANEDFIKLFHLEPSLLFFKIEGISDADEPFEFSYSSHKKIGCYSEFPKLYKILPTDSPERKEKKEKLNQEIMQKVEEYRKQISEYKRPAELNQKKIFYNNENHRMYMFIKTNNKNKGTVWAVFDAAELARAKYNVLKKVLVMGIIAILALILPALTIAQLIAGPLNRLVKQLTQQVEDLDFSRPIAVDTFVSDINQVVTIMNWLTQKLNDAISQAQKAAFGVGKRAGEQAAAVEETSASMEEMSTMTKLNANNAQEANSLIEKVSQEIQQSNNSIKSLIHAMKELSEASNKTAKIVKTIDEIAFQTNLLALNAAVEAARAGETGAGFAVVADEVRALAQRSAEAAGNTAVLIENTVKKINESNGLVNSTSGIFEQLTNSNKKATTLIKEIAAASQEQSQGIGQVNLALIEMDKTTQENAALAEVLSNCMSAFMTDYSMIEE